ncbi:hypothetical protein [Mycobacterium sp.]|uniref:hypothetical protein n=1 Tax=Mycobacterium sp. TaxID=1785 RepID=UPI0034381527
MQQTHPALLNLGADGLAALPAPCTGRTDYVDALPEVSLRGWHLPAVGGILLRPDGYVAG